MTQVAVKERGISFTAWSIPKIINGTKTQTRRAWGLEWVNRIPDAWEFLRMEGDMAVFKLVVAELPSVYSRVVNVPRRSYPLIKGKSPNMEFYIKCPYGQVGDRLWPKESLYRNPYYDEAGYLSDNSAVMVSGTIGDMLKWRWQRDILPAIFMPREASRVLLEITDLRAERLKDITEEDALAEGCNIRAGVTVLGNMGLASARHEFRELWDPLNANYPWAGNYWVWPISFKLLGQIRWYSLESDEKHKVRGQW